jgi:hypothetical protein
MGKKSSHWWRLRELLMEIYELDDVQYPSPQYNALRESVHRLARRNLIELRVAKFRIPWGGGCTHCLELRVVGDRP